MPAETYKWTGAVDGDVTDAGNWLPAGGPPLEEDSIIFPAYSSVDVDGLAVFPSDAADMKGFQSVIIEDGVTYNIGSRILPLNLYMDNDVVDNKITIGGTGTYFLTPQDYGTITITSAGSAPATGEFAVNLVAMLVDNAQGVTAAIHVLCESNQSVGIAAEAGTVGEVDSIVVHGGEVTIGSGVEDSDGTSAIPVTVYGGTVETNMAITTASQDGGTWTHKAGAVTALTVDSGTFFYKSDETAAAVTIGDGGVVDCSLDPSDRTFTALNLYAGASLIDPNETITYDNTIDLNQCRVEDVTLDIGRNFGITKAEVTA